MSVGWPDSLHPEPSERGSRPAPEVMVLGTDRMFADAIGVTLERAGFVVPEMVEATEDAIVIVDEERPEIVLVEIDPAGAGLELGARIARRCAPTKVVALTQAEDVRLVDRTVRLGFCGYLTKGLSTEQFVRSIETIASGHLVVPSRPPPDPAADGPLAQLTGREREVLELLVRGATSTDIAAALGVSDHTVRTHMQNLFAKLGVRSRVQAAAIAVKHGVR